MQPFIAYGRMITTILDGSMDDRMDYVLTRLLVWHLAVGAVLWYAFNEFAFAVTMLLGVITVIRYGSYVDSARQAMLDDLKEQYPDAHIIR